MHWQTAQESNIRHCGIELRVYYQPDRMLVISLVMSPEMVGAAIQVGHHAIVDGQERIEALPLRLQH